MYPNYSNYGDYQNQYQPDGMGSSYAQLWLRWSDFNGVSSRPAYWYVWLDNWLIIIVATILGMIIPFLPAIYGLVALEPMVALTTRRLRDAGFSTGIIITLQVLEIVPFINIIDGIALLICLMMPTHQRPTQNKYYSQGYQNYQNPQPQNTNPYSNQNTYSEQNPYSNNQTQQQNRYDNLNAQNDYKDF